MQILVRCGQDPEFNLAFENDQFINHYDTAKGGSRANIQQCPILFRMPQSFVDV